MTAKTLNIKRNRFFKNYTMTNEPASPTCSVFSSFSWIADKSSSEMKNILKTTFDALAEKERDLKLAAEVGKTLLENNTLLEQKYVALQKEFTIHHQQSTEHFQNKLQTNEHVITTLEAQNAELLKKYEATVESKEKISRQNISNQQKLTAQVNELYSSLEQAYEKIQEHEQYRQDYLKKMTVKDEDHSLTVGSASLNSNHHDNYSEFAHKMDQMLSQNQELLKSKQNIEQQVKNALLQLNDLQTQFNQVQQSKEQFNLLEHKFQHQENHIHQLTSLIEEYRSNLLSDCHHETMPSLIAENASHLSSDDDEDYDRFDALPRHIKGNSLYSELQSAFVHNNKNELDHQYRSLEQENNQMMLISSEHQIVRKDVQKRKKSNSNNMLCIYPGLKLDDSLIAPMTPYHKNLVTTSNSRKVHRSKSVFGQLVQIPINSMYLIWRFIRFFIVIQLAMFIHLFNKK